MELYHGTSTKNIEEIQKEGLKEPFLTNKLDLARYYAEETVEELGGEPMIYTVLIKDEKKLRYDGNAVVEPVGYKNNTIDDLERKVKKMWKEQTILHPEWLKNDYISIPKTEYQLSLTTVASCWYDGVITEENYKILLL